MDVMLPAGETARAPGGKPPGDPRDTALALAALLRDCRAQDVAVLDLLECNSWTSFFVIATAASIAQLRGLERHVKDFCRERDLEILRHSPRLRLSTEDDDWRLTDLGAVVVHLMSERARNFYELERLWSAAPRIFP